ncbi:hypothetical protein FDB15_17410 [Clostridium botulinum]|nr:hypothetical protein [Clostridium botulinum]NFI64805.1 hypothetical protein [Clostridium botulinum]NFJ45410.1 hypothetical protein [Clostridium botulinum]NFJ49082.1 hypothetical protein [Clostridium botulinum]NFK26966.1 hypothetical protein [Clostridium botulinum]
MNNNDWIKLIKENIEEIKSLGVEQFKDVYEYDESRGWYIGVEIDNCGNVYKTSAHTLNTVSYSKFNGEAIEVLIFELKHEAFLEGDFEDYINSGYIKDIEKFKKYIINEYNLDEKDEDFEYELKENLDFYNYEKFNEEKYQELFQQELNDYLESADEEISSQIDNVISNLEKYEA